MGQPPDPQRVEAALPDRDPVAVHEAAWGATLVDPGGGTYVWNAGWETMESTVFGHPGEPKHGHELKTRSAASTRRLSDSLSGMAASAPRPRSSYAPIPDRRPREAAAIIPRQRRAWPRRASACTKTPPADHPAGNRGRPRTESCSEPRRPSARHRSRRR